MNYAVPPRQAAGLLLLIAALVAGYAAALRLVAGMPWVRALWQSWACLLASLVLMTVVVKFLTAPKKLSRLSPIAYRALVPAVILSQYLLPWLGWSGLIWWMNRDQVTWALALRAGGAVAALSYLGGFALVLALRPRATDVKVTRLEVHITGLPPTFDGYQLLHVSDLHGGSSSARASVAARLAAARAVTSDIVVFTGDLAARVDAIGPTASELARLHGRDGRFAVLGNHDTWIGEERVESALSGAGFRVLKNEHVGLSRGGSQLYLAGVKDASYTRQDDLPAALRGIPDGAPIVVLTHSPDVVLKPKAERAALFLAGHTHGGQVVFPWLGPLYVPTRLGRRRMSGLVQLDGRQLFISRGLGEVFLPFRFNCPPEIALITLRPPL